MKCYATGQLKCWQPPQIVFVKVEHWNERNRGRRCSSGGRMRVPSDFQAENRKRHKVKGSFQQAEVRTRQQSRTETGGTVPQEWKMSGGQETIGFQWFQRTFSSIPYWKNVHFSVILFHPQSINQIIIIASIIIVTLTFFPQCLPVPVGSIRMMSPRQ